MSIFTPNKNHLYGSAITITGIKNGEFIPPIQTNSKTFCDNLYVERAKFCDTSGNISSLPLNIINKPSEGYVLTGIDHQTAKWDVAQNTIQLAVTAKSVQAIDVNVAQQLNVFGNIHCKDNVLTSHINTQTCETNVLKSESAVVKYIDANNIACINTVFTDTIECNHLVFKQTPTEILQVKTLSSQVSDSTNAINGIAVSSKGLPGQVLTLDDNNTCYWENTDTAVIVSNEIRTKLLEVEELVVFNSQFLPNVSVQSANQASKVNIYNNTVCGKLLLSDNHDLINESEISVIGGNVYCDAIKTRVLKSNAISIGNALLYSHSQSKNTFLFDHVPTLNKAHVVTSCDSLHITNSPTPHTVLTSDSNGSASWETISGSVNSNSFSIVNHTKNGSRTVLNAFDPFIHRFHAKDNHHVQLPIASPGLSFVIWNATGGTLSVVAHDNSTVAVLPGGGSNRVITFVAFSNGESANAWGRINDITY